MGNHRIRRYTCVRQHDKKDCGPACLSTIARHYGLKLPMTRIREMACTDREGTNALGLIQAAKNLGFSAKLVRGDADALCSDFPLPAIAHVVADGDLLHYVVIHKITPNKVIVADPAKGIVHYKTEQFRKQWTGFLVLMEPAETFVQRDETKGLLTWFIYLLRPQRKLVLSILVASLVLIVAGIGQSFFMQILLDDVLPRRSLNLLNLLIVGLILVTLFRTLLTALRTQLLLYVTRKFDSSMILSYYSHLIKLPMKFFDARETGEIVSRFSDASRIRDTISGTAFTIVIDTLMVLVGGVILYRQNALLFGIICAVVPAYALVVVAFISRFKKLNRTLMEQGASITTYLVETVKGIVTLKAFRAEQQANSKIVKTFNEYQDTVVNIGSTGNLQSSLITLTQAAGDVAIMWTGARLVIAGHVTIGQLMTFISLISFFLVPVQNLINLQASLQSAVVAVDRLGEIMDLQVEQSTHGEGKISPQSLRGDIIMKGVQFRYGTRAPVLKHIDMTIAQGEKIAFVGDSGSGKTTLAKLLLRFYAPERGQIFVGNHNMETLSTHTLRDRIAFVPQETFFFSGSIRENLCLGMDEGVDLARLVHSCTLAHAHSFIEKLPMGYDTLLEENATNLSGGERQRLAIARALLRQPDILIFDEATSNLDTFVERAISETIAGLQDITAIIIAHRMSTIMRCDRIFVLQDGTITETGTHRELVESGGTYFHLWSAYSQDNGLSHMH